MRYLLATIGVALILAACGGDTGVAAGDVTSAPGDAATSSEDVADRLAGGDSGFCGTVLDLVEDLEGFDEEDAMLEGSDLYDFMGDIYGRMAADAPAELENDFAVLRSGIDRFRDWADDPLQPNPLDETEMRDFETASSRIDDYIIGDCGIDLYVEDTDAGAIETEEPDGDQAGNSAATQTISVAGDRYEETLTGDFEVSCDMYGDLETGSINIYLEGPEFQSSVSSYDSGVEPGTYEGQVWVFGSDPDLDELVLDLQEIDGAFVLDQAEPVSDDEWFFAGSFSASVANPPASIEATSSCVGLVGY